MNKTYYPRLDETVFSGQLSNGLTIAVVQKPGFSRKIAYFVTDYGSVHTRFRQKGQVVETPLGVAHYLEHKMFDLPGEDVSQALADLGANANAFTSYDMTAYYFSCTEHFEESLALLLRFVSTPYFTLESVEKEQGIIAQEILMYEDSPDSKVYDDLTAAMYRSHPIREPIAGTVASIRDITPEILYACHESFYNPKNMMLCVVGDVDPAQVEAIAASILPETAPEPGEKLLPEEEELTVSQHFVSRKMDVSMPTFLLGFKGPPPKPGMDSIFREFVGDLGAEALFGESSPLYLQLYEDGIIDTSFGGGYESIRGMSMLSCGGDSDNPEAVRDAIVAEARRLSQVGLEETAFQRMKKSAMGQRVRDLDNFDATCFRLCACHFEGFDYFRFPEVLESVKKEDVEQFLREIANQDTALSVIYPKDQEDSL